MEEKGGKKGGKGGRRWDKRRGSAGGFVGVKEWDGEEIDGWRKDGRKEREKGEWGRCRRVIRKRRNKEK